MLQEAICPNGMSSTVLTGVLPPLITGPIKTYKFNDSVSITAWLRKYNRHVVSTTILISQKYYWRRNHDANEIAESESNNHQPAKN